MQSKLEKHASEACALVVKRANEDAETYAGTGFKRGIIGGAVVGAGKPFYDWARKGIRPSIASPIKGSIATAALWGIAGGLGGGFIKRKQNYDNNLYY